MFWGECKKRHLRLRLFLDERICLRNAALHQVCLEREILLGEQIDLCLERAVPGQSNLDAMLSRANQHGPPDSAKLFDVTNERAVKENGRAVRRDFQFYLCSDFWI